MFCAFRVFDLNKRILDAGAFNDVMESNMQRLAKASNSNMPYAAFKDQWLRFRNVAQQRFAKHNCNKAAWQEAIQAAQRHHGTKRKWGCDALIKVALRFAGWTAATSGVEQNFSKALRSIGPQRMSMSEENEETAIRFAVYKPEQSEIDDLIVNARKIWSETYAAPRTHTTPRVDKGVLRTKVYETAETNWLKQRRNATREAGLRLGDPLALSVQPAEIPGWTEGHDKERIFQAKNVQNKSCTPLMMDCYCRMKLPMA